MAAKPLPVNPVVAPGPGDLSPEAINFASRQLMVFMLAATQQSVTPGQNLVDTLFPTDGSAVNFSSNHLTDLGLASSEIQAFVSTLNTGHSNQDIRNAFGTIRSLFDEVFFYVGPDCPSGTALKNIIVAAAAQTS